MGSADAVPGVSGGTIALITGIYERLIQALTALDPTVIRKLPQLYRRSRRSEFVADLVEMDVPFLVALGGGVGTAIVIIARVVHAALTTIPGPTFAFFFGLIGASAVVLADTRWLRNRTTLAAGVVGFGFAFAVAGASGQGLLPNSLPVIFLAGTVAISGMILPGISGAFILLLLGQYEYMTGTLNDFVDALLRVVDEGVTAQLLDEMTVVVTFLCGGVVGLFTVAYAVQFALEQYRSATLAFLVSLMLGSLRLPAVEVAVASDGTLTSVLSALVAGVVGAGLILLLNHRTVDLTY